MNKHKCSEDKCSNMKFRYLYIGLHRPTHKYQQTYISKHIQKYIIHPYTHTYVYKHIYIHIPTCSCTYIFIYHSNNLFLNLFVTQVAKTLLQLHMASWNLSSSGLPAASLSPAHIEIIQ